jgi:hypothetical protein
MFTFAFSYFGRRKVHFGLSTKFIEVNSLYFTIIINIIDSVDFSILWAVFLLPLLGSLMPITQELTPKVFI